MVRVCVQELTVSEIRVSIKDVLPSSIQDGLDDNKEDYLYLFHEYWCDFLSIIEVKDNRKRGKTHIKKIASDKSAYISDSDGSIRIPRKKNAILGADVLRSNKRPKNNTPKHNVT